MAYQYKLGKFEAAAAIQQRLDPDIALWQKSRSSRVWYCMVPLWYDSTLENHEVPKCCLLDSSKGKLPNLRLVPQIFAASYYKLQLPSKEDWTQICLVTEECILRFGTVSFHSQELRTFLNVVFGFQPREALQSDYFWQRSLIRN